MTRFYIAPLLLAILVPLPNGIHAATAAPGGTVVIRARPNQSLADAVAEAAKTCCELYLPAGEFEVAEPIVLPTGCRLTGAGPSTVLRIAPSARGEGAFYLTDVTDVAIRNLVIDGSNAGGSKMDGVRGANLKRFSLESIQFRNCPKRAINIWGKSSEGTIRNCTCVGTRDRAIVLGGATHCVIEGCVAEGGGSHGIWVLSNARHITVINNDIHDNGGQGIEVFKGCEMCTVAYNRCAGNSLGIHCHTVRRSLLIGNVVERNRSNGIDCNNCAQMRIVGNHSEFNGSPRTEKHKTEGSGILLFRTRDSVVVGNVSINNDQGGSLRSGIQLMDEGQDESLCARNVVTGNVCFDDQEAPTQEVGMRIGRTVSKCPDNLIVANSLGRHPKGPFGGNRRGAAMAAHNWSGALPEAHIPAPPRVPVLKRLPKPEERWHGRIVLVAVEDTEVPHLCRRKEGALQWMRIEE